MAIAQYIKEIGRGARGAKPLSREQATDLFGQVLDGHVSDLEIGAFCLAMRTKARRILASDVLLALDVPALTAPEKIANGTVRHIHTQHLHAGLARLLSVREVVGLRNPGHSVVKLMSPCAGPSVVVTAYTHPEYFE